MKIEQLGPPDAHHSTGLILHWRERLLFALEPVQLWREDPAGPITRFVGIGGHLEAGETWGEAVCREALEEADVSISLRSLEKTHLLQEDSRVQDVTRRLTWIEPHRPLFVWSARHGVSPQMPLQHFVAAVFEADVPDDVQPRPAAEMPAILALYEAQLRKAAIRPLSLDELLAGGAVIWGATTIPQSIRLQPGGSALWYVVLRDQLGWTPNSGMLRSGSKGNPMKLISWNVNGIRAVAKRGFEEWFSATSPDVLCLQETRALPEQVPEALREPPGYRVYWNPAERKGYSGVTTFSKTEPVAVQTGFGIDEFDVEGRVLMTQYPGFKLFNVYFPNGGRGLERLEYKLRFYEALLAHCDALHALGERLIVCGDYNTAHQPVDLARPKRNAKTSGFLEEERAWVDTYLEHGFVDIWRARNPDVEGQYSWWMYMRNARERNIGWRIDYFLVSEALMPAVTGACILSDVMGSDHCPIVLELDTDWL